MPAAVSSTQTLAELVATKHVLITVGAGGVGKTTTAAALSVAAAIRGRRVLCLTIDPAKRLADSLGLGKMPSEAEVVSPLLFAKAGKPMKGSLTAMMLDTKRTFDELVVKYSSSPERAAHLLNNRLYQYVSSSLAGTQEYMAMEKLVAAKSSPDYDLIVLDTPPTANALDFLDAPERLVEALDSATMKWFVDAFQSSGKFSLNVLARSAALVLKGLGKIMGGGFLEATAELISDLNDLFGGFKQRALSVQAALRADDVAFVLVTSPAPMSIQEVLYFDDRLRDHQMPRGAYVVNRLRLPPPFAGDVPVADALDSLARDNNVSLDEGGGERLAEAFRDMALLAALDELHVRQLQQRDAGQVPIVRVPEMSEDVHDIARLISLSEILMNGGV